MNQNQLTLIKNFISTIEKDRNAYIFLEPVDYVGMGLPDYPEIIKHPMDLSTIKKKINDSKYNTIEEIYKDIQLIWDNCKTYNMEGSDVYKMAQYCEKFTKRYFDKHNGTNPPQTSNSNPKSKKTRGSVNGSSNNTVNNKEVSDFKEPPQGNLNMQIPLEEEDNEESKKPEEIEKKEEVTPEEEEDKNDNGNGLTGYEKVTVSNRVKKLQNDGLASLVRLVQKECPNSIKESDDNIEIVLGSLDRKTYEQINRLIDTFLRVKETNQENLEQKKNKVN